MGQGPVTPGRAKRRRRSKTAPNGPELVIDYFYAEDNKDHHDANSPLMLRNVSNAFPAYNVEVLPLETDEGTTIFEPAVIPYIEPAAMRNVFADVREGSQIFSRRLPDFLFKSYKDTDARELFGTKTFILRVRYQGAGSTIWSEPQN